MPNKRSQKRSDRRDGEAPEGDPSDDSRSHFASRTLTAPGERKTAKNVYQGLAMGIFSSDMETKYKKKKKKKTMFEDSGFIKRLFSDLCLKEFKCCMSFKCTVS